MKNEPLSYLEIVKNRRDASAKLMDEYDKTVYYPALKELREWCVNNDGHRAVKWHDNGFGWFWQYCTRCGARFNIEGPDGKH